jgi:CRP-like cAMP-binding protein
LRLIGPGEIFGELALIDDLPRSASVVALEDTVVLTLPRSAYLDHHCCEFTGIARICYLVWEMSTHTLAQLTSLSTGKANSSMAFKR